MKTKIKKILFHINKLSNFIHVVHIHTSYKVNDNFGNTKSVQIHIVPGRLIYLK